MTGICTALALEAGSTPLTVVTVRTLAAIALLAGWLLYSRIPLRLGKRDLAIALLIGIPLCINNYMLNAAIGEIPVPLVVLIFYTWPALTTAASWLLGKERFRWRAAAGLALAFAGVALTLNVPLSAAQALGAWLALGAAVLWSSDTGPTSRLWEIANQTPRLQAICVDTSFDNSLQKIADLSYHLTPQSLAVELRKLERNDVPILLHHLKPPCIEKIREDVRALRNPALDYLEQGRTYNF